MKTLKLLFVALFATLLLVSCEKDENGNRVTYYKDKTVIIYVYSANTYKPVENYQMYIKAFIPGTELFPGAEHIDYSYSEKNGKCFFKFVKKINTKTITNWGIAAGDTQTPIHWFFYKDNINEMINGTIIDTLFIYD